MAQAFYNRESGIAKLSTETGAGQWGSSLAFAGGLFGLEVKVYMVKVSYQQKPYRRALMETYGATLHSEPEQRDRVRARHSRREPGFARQSWIAISEAVEVAAKNADTNYALGSVLNHVLLHQTVIGLEAIEQMEMAGLWPDVVIACAGGGSNFAGIAFPFLGLKLREGTDVRVVAVEPAAARRSPAALTPMTSATPRISPRSSRCTRSAHNSCRPVFTPAACAITAWRRW